MKKIGRPPKKRIPGSGEKLSHALRLCGLSWGANASSPNHILKNTRWLQFKLPRSVNALTADIKDGIPEDRLSNYALFFDINASHFINGDTTDSSDEFKCAILQSWQKINTNALFHFSCIDDCINTELLKQNDHESIVNLFSVLCGVYVAYVKDVSLDKILKIVLDISKHKECHICATMRTRIRDIDLSADCLIYKWGTFLHMNYFTQSNHVVGYMIIPDPTCVPYNLYCTKLTLEIYGISSGILSTTVPNRFYGFAEKQAIPSHFSQSDYCEMRYAELNASAELLESDPLYATVCEKISLVKMKAI